MYCLEIFHAQVLFRCDATVDEFIDEKKKETVEKEVIYDYLTTWNRIKALQKATTAKYFYEENTTILCFHYIFQKSMFLHCFGKIHCLKIENINVCF